MQKVRSHPLTRLLLFVCMRFQDLFHSPPGVLFTVPSQYYALSVTKEYLALEDGPPIFEQDVTCPALLIAHLVPQLPFPVRGYHPLWPDFPDRSRKLAAIECWADPISLAATFGISVDFFS